MKYILSLFLILAFSSIGLTAVTKELKRYELFCTYKPLQEGDTLFGSYLISGYNEQGVALQVYSPTNRLVHHIEREKEGRFEVNATEAGEYKACFRNLDSALSYVTFEWHALIEDEKNHQIAIDEMKQLGVDLEKTVKLVREVRRNLNYKKIRTNIHSANLDFLNSQITWTSFIKVVLIAAFAVGQFMILTGLLNRKYNKISV